MYSDILVIWDLDGTLTDSKPWIFASYRFAARNNGFPEPSDEVLDRYMCGGLQEHILALFGKTGAEAQKMADDYRSYYQEHCFDKVEFFDGAREALDTLRERGVSQAVATMKLEPAAIHLMEKLGVKDHFVRIAGSDPEGHVTKPMMIRSCMDTGKYRKVIMVGDCRSDLNAANEVGVDFIAAAFGYGLPEKKCAAEGIEYIEDIRDITKII